MLAADFEGVITMKGSSDGESTTYNIYFKAGKMRADDGDTGFSVWDAQRKEGLFVDLQDHTFTVIPWHDLTAQNTKKLFDNLTVTKTGKTAKIAGYGCEIYLSKDKSDGGTSELCVAKGLSNAALYGMITGEVSGRGGYPAWFRELVKDGGFPLLQVDRDKSGTEESRLEATRVETKRLDDSLFVPPAGFTKAALHK
jgi:hypothetical protein